MGNFPNQESNLCPLQRKFRVLTTEKWLRTTREVLVFRKKKKNLIFYYEQALMYKTGYRIEVKINTCEAISQLKN